jgi:hypothetical protein
MLSTDIVHTHSYHDKAALQSMHTVVGSYMQAQYVVYATSQHTLYMHACGNALHYAGRSTGSSSGALNNTSTSSSLACNRTQPVSNTYNSSSYSSSSNSDSSGAKMRTLLVYMFGSMQSNAAASLSAAGTRCGSDHK